MASTFVVHLIGFPGAGKYTIARSLVSVAQRHGYERFVVVDNHLTSNPVLSVLDAGGVRGLPARSGITSAISAKSHRTIEELSPPGWSFVFTNVLTQANASDQAVIDRLRRLAEARGSRYVPVQVNCAEQERLRRVPNPDRAARHKWVHADGVAAFLNRERLLRADGDQLDIDVTALAPVDAADVIVRHLDVIVRHLGVAKDHEWDVDPAGWVRQQRRADPRRGGLSVRTN